MSLSPCNDRQRDKRTAVSHALLNKCSPSVLEEDDRRPAEVEGPVEGVMTTAILWMRRYDNR